MRSILAFPLVLALVLLLLMLIQNAPPDVLEPLANPRGLPIFVT